MKKENWTPFDVLEVPLEKKNLVEASAGTGKTFSIAVMVLRLIVEKELNIKEILLVTFTNNAVAELDERIRIFLRSAFDYAKNDKPTLPVIKKVIDRSTRDIGTEAVIKGLNDSILFLDETSVMTIHSFCHQTLNNLAFETGQPFDAELVTNFDDVITAQVQDFWRNQIVTLPVEILSLLSEIKFSREAVFDVVKKFLSGKRYHAYSQNKKYAAGDEQMPLLDRIKTMGVAKADAHKNCGSLLEPQKETLKKQLEADRFAKVLVEHLDSIDSFIAEVTKRRDKNYIDKLIPKEILAIIDQHNEEKENTDTEARKFIDLLFCAAIEKVTASVSAYCNSKGIQSFDGLIKDLHKALAGANKEKIVFSLKRQYRAVFIDEFQDTDKLQYDIFLESFGSNVILFFIGDPKQSIYAFRQADINTYFRAYKDVDNRYNMNINFRSSTPVIDAMNEFFSPLPGFDFFHFQNAENTIEYFKVASPEKNSQGDLVYGGKKETGITIRIQEIKDIVMADAARQVFQLLTDDQFQIVTSEGSRRIIPADIGILVKSKDCGHEIRQILGRYNIPSVFVADEKIMETEDAKELYQVIKAIFDPAIENINAALINNFTGFRSKDAISFDAEKVIELFKGYKSIWETQSIYSSLAAFISDFGIEDHLRKPETDNGLRIVTNLYQLMELMHKTAYHQRLNPAELLNWYKRALEIELLEKDESTLRLESDADAVTIMTIHKSKGLEFNIVIAPQMNLRVSAKKDRLESLYDNDEYITIRRREMNDQQEQDFLKQSEQEFRRLMYVAVTRAVYKAIVFHCSGKYFKSSFLTELVPLLKNAQNIEISEEQLEVSSIDYSQKYQRQKNEKPIAAVLKNEFKLKDPFWRYMSYSQLAAKDAYPLIVAEETMVETAGSEYDDFVFSKLRKGNITGNMVHQVFERIHFNDAAEHNHMMSLAISRYAASSAEIYKKYLPELISQVLHAQITTGSESFQLASISTENKIAEMEFDFSTANCNASKIISVLNDAGISVQLKNNVPLHGLMKGFIDLLFLYNGKYYILDWKTNFLGRSLDDYSAGNLETAMELNNYHLQYLIYIIAAKKYLQVRLGTFYYSQFGGVIYCFIRGMRANASDGIFFKRPSEKMVGELENMLTTETMEV